MSGKTACEMSNACMEDPECSDFLGCVSDRVQEERRQAEQDKKDNKK